MSDERWRGGGPTRPCSARRWATRSASRSSATPTRSSPASRPARCRWGERGSTPSPGDLLATVEAFLRPSQTRDGLRVAQALPGATSAVAASVLGSGREVSAQDTVPFAVWAAAHHLGDVVETFWTAVAGLGDRDTTSAMACGIVAAGTGADGIPPDWLVLVEPLPAFVPPAGSAPPADPGPPAESGSGS